MTSFTPFATVNGVCEVLDLGKGEYEAELPGLFVETELLVPIWGLWFIGVNRGLLRGDRGVGVEGSEERIGLEPSIRAKL